MGNGNIPEEELQPEQELEPEDELQAAADLTDQLIQEFEQHPDEQVREKVFQLLDAVDRLHRPGLRALMQFLESKKLWGIIEQARSDPVIRTLLELYDLMPRTEEQQVQKALDLVRPYMQSHGGEIDVLAVTDGVVRVRLKGSCHGCSGSAVTLKRGVEEALKEGFPGFKDLEVEEPPPPTTGPSFISLDEVAEAPGKPIFLDAVRLEEVSPGSMKGVMLEGVNVLICNVDGEVYALQNACQGRGLPLNMGELREETIICRWHGCRYDARTGKAIPGGDDRHMAEVDIELFPVAVTEDGIQVAVNVPHKGDIVGSAPGKREG